jgi:hypothetical protein
VKIPGVFLARSAGLLGTALLLGCDAVVPEMPTAASAGRETASGDAPRAIAAVAVNQPPQVVFKVEPAPNADRVIAGTSPFELHLNVCRSADSETDTLLYTMDADGDGRLDESGTSGGSCRRTFTYTAKPGDVRDLAPKVCVVDLDADGKPRRDAECRTYAVRVAGPAEEVACADLPGTTINTLTRQITWEEVPGAVSYNLYLKTIPNCTGSGSATGATRDDQKFANVQSPFDVSSLDLCGTCYYVTVTSVTRTCETPPAGGVGFGPVSCRAADR